MAFVAGYAPEEAGVCMTLAAMSYASESDPGALAFRLQALLADSRYATGARWELLWLGTGPPPTAANIMYVARQREPQERYAIVVRGTDWRLLRDAWEDFNVFSTRGWPTARPPGPDIQVAAGSWDGLDTLLAIRAPRVGASAGDAPVSLRDLLGSLARGRGAEADLDILVTGHSLGGALATLLGTWLVDETTTWGLRPHGINFKIYTFAAPTVGNGAYATYADAQRANPQVGFDAYRVLNTRDVVPFGFGNLGGISTCGIPFDERVKIEIDLMTAGARVLLDERGIRYVDVGDSRAGTVVSLVDEDGPPSGPNPVCTLADVNVWAGHGHCWNTYLRLLGATPLPFSSGSQT